MSKKLTDEILELLWSMKEKGSKSYKGLIDGIGDKNAHEVMKKMEKSGLIVIEDDSVELKDKGLSRARDLTRRHRLAERLFHDVLDVDMEESEYTACEMEHFLSPTVTDSVCSFLGHPPTCPHGKPIPRGDCCSKYKHTFKPIVMQLKELEVGANGRIVFIVPSEDSRLERLSSLGIIAGSTLKLKQKKPSFVVQVDETTLALDSAIADGIYVKQL
ncbi:MAG: metal-dependent transcriptional regulator [Nitrospirae bacterium]|nr:metal-dependent transcriptional regulator [Nitrospirota bacterium]